MSQNLDTKDPPRGVTFWQAFIAIAIVVSMLGAYYALNVLADMSEKRPVSGANSRGR